MLAISPMRTSGPLEGNYVGMAEKSDNWKLMHEASFVLNSSKAYRAGGFSFPFVLSLKAQVPTHGLNTPKQSFVELSLASFFSTAGNGGKRKPAMKFAGK